MKLRKSVTEFHKNCKFHKKLYQFFENTCIATETFEKFSFPGKNSCKVFKIPILLPLFCVSWSYFPLDYASFIEMKLGR